MPMDEDVLDENNSSTALWSFPPLYECRWDISWISGARVGRGDDRERKEGNSQSFGESKSNGIGNGSRKSDMKMGIHACYRR